MNARVLSKQKNQGSFRMKWIRWVKEAEIEFEYNLKIGQGRF
jgi:hypothetical protein